jgi:mannose-6-phosphate isomerase-like protein (cupin superfamily)
MGRIAALFKADGKETLGVLDLRVVARAAHERPGAHAHAEDDVFFVLEGTMSFLLGDRWVDAPRGSFVLAPGGVTHDFQNRTDQRAGVLNISVPGDFEDRMPAIAEWFAAHPPEDA